MADNLSLPNDHNKIKAIDFLDVVSRLTNYNPKTGVADCPVPGHDTPHKTLSVRDAGDKFLVHCFGGHTAQQVLSSMGLDSFTYTKPSQAKSVEIDRKQHPLNKVSTYIYTDKTGEELYIKERWQSDIPKDKEFYFFYKINGIYITGRGESKPVFYRLPELIEDIKAQKAIRIAGGEAKVDLLRKWELPATCLDSGEGKGKWKPEYSKYLKGLEVLIYQDHDRTGEEYTKDILTSLLSIAKNVKVIDFKELNEHGDILDWVKLGHTVDELNKIENETEYIKRPTPLERPNKTTQNYDQEKLVSAEIERIKALSISEIDKSLITMDQVESRPIHWWWYPYFAFGKIHLISGDPGTAKSTISLGLTALITKGGGEAMGVRPVIGSVLILSAEDDPNDTIKPKLEMMGADCSKVILPRTRFSLDDVGIVLLQKYVSIKNIVLVIIDPISAWFDAKVNLNASNEVRKYLAQLGDIAQTNNLIMIMIRHLNKGKNEKAIYRGNASIDFTGAARSELMAIKDDNNGGFGLIHIKTNIGPEGKTIGYSLTDNGPESPPTFQWTGYTDLKYQDTTEESHSTLNEAIAWITARLEAGKVESNQLLAEAKKEGITFATLKRAKKKMSDENVIHSFKDKSVKDGPWFIELLPPKNGEEAQG